MSTPQNYCCQCLCPCSEPQLPPPHSAVDTSIPGSSSGPCLYEVTGFFPVSWCTRDPVCPLQVWSFCFPQSYEIPVIKLHWPSKQIPGGILLLLSDPQAREPDMGLRTITPVGEPLRYNYFPVCGLPTRWVWDLILSWLRPSYYLMASSLSLDVGTFFGRFKHFFVDGCLAVTCDFVRRGVLTCFYCHLISASPKYSFDPLFFLLLQEPLWCTGWHTLYHRSHMLLSFFQICLLSAVLIGWFPLFYLPYHLFVLLHYLVCYSLLLAWLVPWQLNCNWVV